MFLWFDSLIAMQEENFVLQENGDLVSFLQKLMLIQ